jgi:hypothetical protein
MHLCELGLIWGIFQVSVIALFTKFDQFKRDIKMRLEDQDDHPEVHFDFDAEVKRVFEQFYLARLRESIPFICLEGEDFITNKPVFL